MRKIKIVISIVLAVTFLVTACNKNNITEPDNSQKSAEFTNIDLVLYGLSDYKIVVPSIATNMELFSAKELKTFFEQSTGAALPTLTDEEISFNENDKVISVGKTAILNGSGLQASEAELGKDGYKIVTKGNTVIIAGGGDDGLIYGVYEFLAQNLGIEFYATDEIYLPQNTNLKLKKFSLTETPDFKDRATGFYAAKVDQVYRYRMRTAKEQDNWALWAHTHFTIIPPQTYLSQHPDWFSSDINTFNNLPGQLCLTNEEMHKEFVKNTISIIVNNPSADFIMLGQEDWNSFCTCENCKPEVAKYKESGVMMRFINAVAKDVKQQLKEIQPDRNIILSTFAYQKTQDPPVVLNQETGQYLPIDSSVIAEDNVAIMIAPLYCCYAHNMLDERCNSAVSATLLGWAKVSNNLQMWSYCTNFGSYMIPFNNLSAIQENYKIFKELGVQYLFDQGTLDSMSPNFHEYRVYLHSKLMWDINIDTKQLTKNFFENYYKAASSEMLEFYNLIRTHYAELEVEKNIHTYPSQNLGMAMMKKEYWSKNFLDNNMEIFQRAYAKIDEMAKTDPENAQKAFVRVKRESLAIRFLLLDLYGDMYQSKEKLEMIDSFEKDSILTNITAWGELLFNSNKTITNKIAEWKSKI